MCSKMLAFWISIHPKLNFKSLDTLLSSNALARRRPQHISILTGFTILDVCGHSAGSSSLDDTLRAIFITFKLNLE